MINEAWKAVERAFDRSAPDEALELIQKGGFDVNASSEEDEFTLLCRAILRSADLSVLRALVEAGADPTGASCWHSKGSSADVRRPAGVPIVLAASSLDPQRCSFLLEAGADVNEVNCWEDTALIVAAYDGKEDVAALLLRNGADVDYAAQSGTALAKAARASEYSMVRFLLAQGADPNIPNYRGDTPIQEVRKKVEKRLRDLTSPHSDARAFARATPPVLRLLAECEAVPEADRQAALEVLAKVEVELKKDEAELAPLGEPDAVARRSWFSQVKKRIKAAEGNRTMLELLAAKVLATPAAVGHKRWADLVVLLLEQSRTYEDVAEELYETPVKYDDDEEGPLWDAWQGGTYVTVDIVFDKVLSAAATVAGKDWAAVTAKALKGCDTYDFVPEEAIRSAMTAGAEHPEYSAVLTAVDELARARALSSAALLPGS
jgi:hypothetical protein